MTDVTDPSEKPRVQLIGKDGNAFSIMASCRYVARRAGWSEEKIDALLEEMMSGDYNHLLQTAMKHFEVY